MNLVDALNPCAAHAPEYGGGLSNHLSATLVALERLGADEARLSAFAAAYAPRLQPEPLAQTWPAGDPWPDRLGQYEAWPAYRALFAEWIAQEGASDMLGPVLAARGLLLIGLDVIGDRLTEINVTSPTCFREIMDQTGFDVAAMFMDALEAAVAAAA